MKNLSKNEMNAIMGGIGKREKAHGKVVSIDIRPKLQPSTPSGGGYGGGVR